VKPAPYTLGLALAGLLAAAVPASAQTPTATPPAIVPTVTPTPSPPPAAAPGKLRAVVKGGYKMDGKRLALAGDKLKVKGRLRPGFAGQRVQIRVNDGGKTVKTRKATVKRSGRFSVPVRLKNVTGKVTLSAVHKASGKVAKAQSRKEKLRVLEPSLHYGSDGPVAALFNRELRQLKYAAPHSGTFDDATGRAVLAYRKVNNLARTESTTNGIVRDVMHGKGGYKVRYPELGKHVEADLSQQILALVDGDKLVRVYHTSSGAPATPTIIGTFRFYMQTYGTNSVGMVHSSYFIRGYAIHGYHDVPTYNASHGCLRVPIPDAYTIFNWIDIGDQIRVTY
jgi:lipoprotein-anchoring transpeptidase ErfK/SrfK